MSDQAQAVQNVQNQTTDEFFYFFLRLRKDRVPQGGPPFENPIS